LLSAFVNVFKIPELKRRVIITFLLLAVYRVGVAVPVPEINGAAMAAYFEKAAGTIFGLFSMFSGGALSQGSIFALGIMPYISASIILQLLTVVWPYLERLSKEGESGRRKITQYTRYGTIILSFFQGFMIAYGLQNDMLGPGVVPHYEGILLLKFMLMTAMTLTAGTAFIMWLGEQISEFGIGNGISLIIFGGIVARLPIAIFRIFQGLKDNEMKLFEILPILIVMIGVVGLIIFVERAQRRIPIQHAKRVVGRRVYGGTSTHLPLKVNTAGVIPPIFASSILMFPSTIAQFVDPEKHQWIAAVTQFMQPGRFLYESIYVVLIIFFCYFYTAVTFNPVDVADNLKKSGAYIPGFRPGKRTADYIDRVLTRITFGGALYVSAVCVLPSVLIQKFNVPFYFGGTALLIVVGVGLDLINQLESHMLMRHYDGFLGKGAKFKGRR
jgi:preprotein translocase subunit SecY